jgi:hypothetical protein
METKFRIIETLDYHFAISDQEVKEDVCIRYSQDKPYMARYDKGISEKQYRIIGYSPKRNAPKLDLPLFPQIVVEDDVEGTNYQNH